MKRRKIGTGLLVAGTALVLVAVGFRLFAVPVLVRFPSDLDKTVHYSGTYTEYFDQRTATPLAAPVQHPFRLDRHVHAVDSSASTVVLAEDLTLHQGAQTLHQRNQYVMDRRSMKLEGGSRSWSISPKNLVNRTGAYRLTFPLGVTRSGVYNVWNNETGATYRLVRPSRKHVHAQAGVDVLDFHGHLERPVTHAYSRWLGENGFPTELSPAQLQARLRNEGVDLAAALADVNGLLTPDERATLTKVLTRTIPLRYRFFFSGQVSIEPKTGAIMDVHTQTEGLKVKPDLSSLHAMAPILTKYASIPSVASVAAAVAKVEAEPPAVAARYRFTEDAASSAMVGQDARDQARLIDVVEVWAPWAVGLLGGAVIIGGLLTRRGRRQTSPSGASVRPRRPQTQAVN